MRKNFKNKITGDLKCIKMEPLNMTQPKNEEKENFKSAWKISRLHSEKKTSLRF